MAHPAERAGRRAGLAAAGEDVGAGGRRVGDELLAHAADRAADWLAHAGPYADPAGESRATYLASYLVTYAAVWREQPA